MPSIADLYMEQGAAGANAISRRGNIYADLIRNMSSAPGQVVQQARADQVEKAREEEANQRLGLQSQQLELQRGALADQEAQRQRNLAGTQALSTAIQQHTTTDPETGHLVQDHDAIYNDVAKVDPSAADAWYAHATTHTKLVNEIQNDQLASTHKKLELTGNLASSVLDAPPENRPAAYAAMLANRDTLFKNDPQINGILGKLPPDYSPALDATLTAIKESARNDSDRAKEALNKSTIAKNEADAKKLQAEADAAGKPKPMTEYERGKLTLDQQESALKAAEDAAKRAADAAKKATGKTLPVGEVDKISELDKSISAVRDLRDSLSGGKSGTMANLEANLVPDFVTNLTGVGAEAKATQADIVRAQQVVGRIIHGGVMRANDQKKAEEYMPKLGDSPDVIRRKLDAIEKLGNDSKGDHIGNLGKAGYDVTNFQEQAAPTTEPAAPAGVKRFNPKTGKLE